ncbi:hypothetical protein EVAR_91241_1 [Eumeta japonica]|uniref:Uncharacterized protein n=1 Tax=Eumeta variegata TaxID=151549 RepID=A0A4C2A243_EUMVA|nr:hypothetical protein EVAR_91241_1 [Eumeta japonica]
MRMRVDAAAAGSGNCAQEVARLGARLLRSRSRRQLEALCRIVTQLREALGGPPRRRPTARRGAGRPHPVLDGLTPPSPRSLPSYYMHSFHSSRLFWILKTNDSILRVTDRCRGYRHHYEIRWLSVPLYYPTARRKGE